MGLLYLYRSMELNFMLPRIWKWLPDFWEMWRTLFYGNPSSHYHVHKILTLVSVLNQINPFHTIPFFFHNILFDVIHLCLGLPSDFFSFRFFDLNLEYTGLFEMIVGVLTTCHTQYTWDRSICIFLFNRTTLCYIPYRCSICAPFVILQTSTR